MSKVNKSALARRRGRSLGLTNFPVEGGHDVRELRHMPLAWHVTSKRSECDLTTNADYLFIAGCVGLSRQQGDVDRCHRTIESSPVIVEHDSGIRIQDPVQSEGNGVANVGVLFAGCAGGFSEASPEPAQEAFRKMAMAEQVA